MECEITRSGVDFSADSLKKPYPESSPLSWDVMLGSFTPKVTL